MALLSRRDAGKLLLAGWAGALAPTQELLSVTKINSVVRGVQIGAQAWSFRDRPLNACIAAFREVGLGECELADIHFQMANNHGADINQWRLDTPLSYFQEVRKKFDEAGVSLSAYGYNMSPKLTDEMIERGFQATRAMGLNCMTTTTRVSMVPRIDQYAQKYKVMVGYHNHDKTSEPDEVASIDSFARVLKGASSYARINLDIGHFTAGNQDPVAFLREHHARIVTLHIKDRKKDHGPQRSLRPG
jgi:sugar phosphate isomerase/epimerase